MQLLRLVYIAHGWSLGLLNEPLVNEEPEAWQHKPVFPAVYRAFRKFGAGGISERATTPFGPIASPSSPRSRLASSAR
ncbi:type II toxin-antitoxin system antitoxin SocA domain-containing protein [Sphingomonas xinjiangensis]|uniref:Panacea domain-containing protein n=1 Tax=Sphingomonas xinjiangensis TaxID=643568 RepID=UPI00161D4926